MLSELYIVFLLYDNFIFLYIKEHYLMEAIGLL